MTLKVETGEKNPILRKKSVKVTKFDKKLKKLLKDMMVTMLAKDGVGLAAPQVGINERIVVLNLKIDGRKWQTVALINPEILDASVVTVCGEEGCLSLPGIVGEVERHETATVKFLDESGKLRLLELEGLNARAIQHEVDHLDGILFTDRAKKIRKEK
ncbi:MAG: peptide deformylase [Candidatus Peribacteraceae bacterium]|nr:peptide deformylase [Candidatus Peribacteraceae bacterium]